MRRHFRGLAHLCVLGIAIFAMRTAFKIIEGTRWRFDVDGNLVPTGGLGTEDLLGGFLCLLALVTAIAIYSAKAPWADPAAKVLTVLTFGSAFFINLGAALPARSTHPHWVILLIILHCGIVFPYLSWLLYASAKRAVR